MSQGYLLDTHALLWWMGSRTGRLSEQARAALTKGRHRLFLSAGAAWEMAIKKSLGRLSYPGNLDEVLDSQRIEVLPIKLSHALAVADLPSHHRDPFDRIQIAQARIEDLVLVTRDSNIAKYEVSILKA